ncbi:hypothetical protein HNQ94_001551 [Salirhabdus euzebyi]|uniref:Thymidylate kinase n=1 Tax=Salirhabdus euzebyi TaxID=394506 RepID=A0A841Q415_9BACI|nr:hypothetical protein [Salirhabdus euzebyi]MBB6453103.1 hypothetical protein [Salirhabdus euzebyi]
MKNKLIMVEGVPGSGKSTTAKYIYEKLKEKGIDVRFFPEGDTEHPADYESVAYLSEEQLKKVMALYPDDQPLIEKFTEKKGDFYFVHYYDLYHEQPDKEYLVRSFQVYDIYEQPLEIFEKLALDYWKEFVEEAKKNDVIYLFECCYIQNSFTKFIAYHNANIDKWNHFIQQVSKVVNPLHPKLIYLYQDNIEPAFTRVYEKRSAQWAEFFIAYHTENGYGKANNLKGLEGTIHYLSMRQNEEIKAIKQLEMDSILIKNDEQEWDSYYQTILNRLQ